MIRFLFKTVFFLILLFAAITFFIPSSTERKNGTDSNPGTTATLGAIRDTMMDMGNFCERNRQACETGKAILGSIGGKARDGARFAYEFLDSKFGEKDDMQAAPETQQ